MTRFSYLFRRRLLFFVDMVVVLVFIFTTTAAAAATAVAAVVVDRLPFSFCCCCCCVFLHSRLFFFLLVHTKTFARTVDLWFSLQNCNRRIYSAHECTHLYRVEKRTRYTHQPTIKTKFSSQKYWLSDSERTHL